MFIFEGIIEGIRAIFLGIDVVIYNFISYCYQIFLYLAGAQIFSEQIYREFANRIYVLIGVVMLFIISFSLLKAIVNPDELTKGDQSTAKIASNVLISLILIALVPTIFSYAYRVQDAVLKTNFLGKIIIGESDRQEVEVPIEFDITDDDATITKYETHSYSVSEEAIFQGGNNLAATAWSAFFFPREGWDKAGDIESSAVPYWSPTSGMWVSAVAACGAAAATGAAVGASLGSVALPGVGTVAGGTVFAVAACTGAFLRTYGGVILSWFGIGKSKVSLDHAYDIAYSLGDFSFFSLFKSSIGEDITYYWILSTIAGLFILFVVVSFCFDLGIRVVKLGFYQMIAPIPVLARIMPGQKKIFDNWVKAVSTTFLEVFIRVAIIYFGVLLISQVPYLFTDSFRYAGDTNNISTGVRLFAQVFIIMGIVAFMRQAPKLIGDLFGLDAGNIKLGIGEKLRAGGGFIAGGIVGGGISSAVRNFTQTEGNAGAKIRSAIGGLGAGAVRGGRRNAASQNFADVRKNTGDAIKRTTEARDTRDSYRATHGGTTGGVITGHIEDLVTGGRGWATGKKQYRDNNPLSEVEYHDDAIATHGDLRKYWGSEFDEEITQLENAQANVDRNANPEGWQHYENQLRKARARRDELRHNENNIQATADRLDTHLDQLLENPDMAQRAGYDVGAIRRMADHLSRDERNRVLYDGNLINYDDLNGLLTQAVGRVRRWDNDALVDNLGNALYYDAPSDTYYNVATGATVNPVNVQRGAMLEQDARLGAASGIQLSQDRKKSLEGSADYRTMKENQAARANPQSGNQQGDK